MVGLNDSKTRENQVNCTVKDIVNERIEELNETLLKLKSEQSTCPHGHRFEYLTYNIAINQRLLDINLSIINERGVDE